MTTTKQNNKALFNLINMQHEMRSSWRNSLMIDSQQLGFKKTKQIATTSRIKNVGYIKCT